MAVAVGEGHVGVHFQQHHARAADRRHGVVGCQRQAEIAVLVHRRGHRHHDVGGRQAAVDQQRQLGEVGRDVIHPARLAARTGGAAEEVGVVADVGAGLGVEVGELAQRQDLAHRHVAQRMAAFGQRMQQGGRLADAGGDDHGVAVLDQTDGVGGHHAFLLVQGFRIAHAESAAS